MGGRGGRIFQESGKASKLPIFEDERRIQQPDSYNKKKLSELGLTEHLHFRTATNIKMHERAHFMDHTEQAGVFDKTGKMLYHKRGEQTSVSIPSELAKGNICTHNHPATIPVPSPQDVRSFVYSEQYEERVTGLSGQVVRIWHKDYTKRDKAKLEAFVKEYQRVFSESQRRAEELFDGLKSKKLAKERYEGMTIYYLDNYPDYITAQIDYLEKHMNFEKYGINYSRTKEF